MDLFFLHIHRDTTGRETLLASPSNKPLPGEPPASRIYRLEFPDQPTFSSLASIESIFRYCRRCPLAYYRINMVSHRGSPTAKIALVGQSPGRTEDEEGLPFVGPSGRLLEEMLRTAGVREYFVTNVVACRPEDGPRAAERTDPTPLEQIACSQRLWETLNLVRPNIVIALGLIPAGMFWNNPKKIQRNTLFRVSDKLLVGQTFHPAYLLRVMQRGNQHEKAECIEFLHEVSVQAENLEQFTREESWGFGFPDYPFRFLQKFLQKGNK